MKLTNWKARRAGGRITITGFGEAGEPAKIVGVDVIEPDPDNNRAVYALDKNGDAHIL